jgi:hypothetical protein
MRSLGWENADIRFQGTAICRLAHGRCQHRARSKSRAGSANQMRVEADRRNGTDHLLERGLIARLGRQRVDVGGSAYTGVKVSSDPDEFAEADRLNRAAHDEALQNAAHCVARALRPFIDHDRKRALNLALEALDSNLAVRLGS